MAGKTLIGGTSYTVSGGKTKVGGTAYSIKSGKTLIGGTAKSISFSSTPANALYWLGDECTSRTGGWVFPTIYSTEGVIDSQRSANITRTKNADSISLITMGENQIGSMLSINKISFSGYSTLKILYDYVSEGYNYGGMFVGIYDSNPQGQDAAFSGRIKQWAVKQNVSGTYLDQTFSTSISSYQSNYYLVIRSFINSSSGRISLTIKKVWLE